MTTATTPMPAAVDVQPRRATAATAPAVDVASVDHRRDIQGMRAVAVLLVVLYHAGVPRLTAGYIGVDVFFVISGFVITNLLVRELSTRGSVSVLRFYGRRAQRIIPLAAVVILATVVASYDRLGYVRAGRVAYDGQFAAAFGANLHFAAEGTDYLGSQLAPSPLQHYWSLSVEEQFYVVWPVLLWLLFRLTRGSRTRLPVLLGAGAVLVASYVWSGVQTDSNGVVAYFSTLTRGCELMAGALVAIAASSIGAWNMRRSPRVTEALVLGGLAIIVGSAFVLDKTTPFPGWAVALPVVGTVMVIAAAVGPGIPAPSYALLSNPVMVFIGDISFSLYLWHWPLLTIAQEERTTPLPASHRAALLGVAFLLSLATYFGLENPLRGSRWLKKNPLVSVVIGLALIGVVFGVLIAELYGHPY